ncbi:MAG TPA: tetratricopeptide repeat protein [Anaeromyxobacter sp.]|nr:tetratricopeptide repeat protein [Anaeromyxobacter sp.]
MRAYVLTDARLAKLAGRVVRLEVDTEKPRNAPFVERFPIDAWPTLLAIDPATEQVVLRWAGTATAAQIERLALDAERAIRAGQTSRADEALARADRLMGERRHAQAAAAYREALQAGGKGWERRERAAEAVVQASGFAGDPAACAGAAREVLPALAPGAAAARAAAPGLACALELDDDGARAAALDALEPLGRKALAAGGVLADDRSWLYDQLAKARADRGDAAGARAVARRWLAFLEGEAARARTPLARSAFDGQRLQAAIRAGEPARALPALLASERDLPHEFVPPTNLGVLYLELGRPKDALAAAERALARAGGPRRIRVLVLRAQAQDALGDRAAARATLERALSEAAALPDATRPKGYTAKAEKLLAELGGAAPE